LEIIVDNWKATGPLSRLAVLLFILWPTLKAMHMSVLALTTTAYLGGGWFFVWKYIGKKKNWQYSFLYGRFHRRDPKHKIQLDYLKKDPLLTINVVILLLYAAAILLAHSSSYTFVPDCASVILITFWFFDLIEKPEGPFSTTRG
jgi:hypothetical protein